MRNVVIAVAVSVLGCVTTNPAWKTETDKRVSALGHHQESAPSSYAAKDWKPGSWLAFKSTNGDKVSYTKLSVLSNDAEGYWLESETWSYDGGHSITKILYSGMPRTKEDTDQMVKKIVTKTNDEAPQTMDMTDTSNPMVGLYRSMSRSVNVSAPADVSSMPKETVTVASGTYAGCAKYTGTFSFGPISQTVDAWWHPELPVNGMVKSVSTDGKYNSEVLDYGWSGAQSALP